MPQTTAAAAPPVGLEHKSAAGVGLVDVNDAEGVVEAIVSVTGVRDRVDDVILPGAYRGKPIGVWSHDDKVWVSRTEDVKELPPGDPKLPTHTADGRDWPKAAGGLWVKTRYNLDTQAGKDAFSNVRFFAGQTGWSIGYRVPPGGSYRKDGVRWIKQCEVWEYSPVMVGAASEAMTLSVKAATAAAEDMDVDLADDTAPATPEPPAEPADQADGYPPGAPAKGDEPYPPGEPADDDEPAGEDDAEDEPAAVDEYGTALTELAAAGHITAEEAAETAAAGEPAADPDHPDDVDEPAADPDPEQPPAGEQPAEARPDVPSDVVPADAGEQADGGEVKAGPPMAVRKKLAGKGHAMPDGSFPIRDRNELEKAISAFGRAKDKDAAKRHIIKRARALGLANLIPDSWSDAGKKTAVADDPADAAVDDTAPVDGVKYDTGPVGDPGGRQNWVDKAGGLPPFLRAVAHALMRQGRSESAAIQTAYGTIRRWAAGGGKVTAKTRAKAAEVVAWWEAHTGKAAPLADAWDPTLEVGPDAGHQPPPPAEVKAADEPARPVVDDGDLLVQLPPGGGLLSVADVLTQLADEMNGLDPAEVKAGRVLSGRNSTRLRSAVQQLLDVLAAAGVELGAAGEAAAAEVVNAPAPAAVKDATVLLDPALYARDLRLRAGL